MKYGFISPENLKSNLNKYVIIDVREQKKYNEYHIDGAINIYFEDVMEKRNFFDVFSREDELVIYCENGGSSIYVANKLSRMGYRVYSLSGGINAYQKNNFHRL